MSQNQKLDIADFFRPYSRQLIPRKRPTSEPDNDDVVFLRESSAENTPSTVHVLKSEPRKVSRTSASPLTTPRTTRFVSIPIRSPSSAVTAEHIPLFDIDNEASLRSPSATVPFKFADAPNLSLKIIEDGKLIAVRDSDESDDESLASLTDLLNEGSADAPNLSNSHPTSSGRQEDERVRLLSMYTGGRSVPIVNRERMRALQRKKRETTYDLSSVLDEDRKEEEASARIAQIEAELEASTRELQEVRQSELDKKLLAAILQGDAEDIDPDELTRVISAFDRTEALSGERCFSFFSQGGPNDLSRSKRSKRVYPASAIPGDLWQPNDVATRESMYRSGFMLELAVQGKISDEALRWTYDSILHEPKEDLRYAYLQCVAGASHRWTRTNITPEDVQDVFVSLGAESRAIRDNATIEARRSYRILNKEPEHHSLLTVLSTFNAICHDLDFATLSKLTSLVCRLSLDEMLMAHNQVMHAVESLLCKLAEAPDSASQQHIHERVLSDLETNLKEPTLQAQFMSHFISTSSAAARLRTNLAATFLLGSSRAAKLFKAPGTKSPLVAVLNHVVASPVFRITPEADFQNLTANVYLLDIVISSGYPSSLDSNVDRKTFDTHVDDLADKIHDLFTSIADTGASHMRRTETKDVLQALHSRLLFAVRTKIRRKKHIFDTSGDKPGGRKIKEAEEVRQEAEGQSFMQRFLKRQDMKSEEDQQFMDVYES